jgi:hypothetical protein
MTQTHIGIAVHRIRRHDTDCFIAVIDLQAVRVKLTQGFASVTDAAVRHGATLATNGGGWGLWSNKSLPNEYLVIEGHVIQDQSFDGRPCMEITKDGQIKFLDRPNLLQAYNVFGFDRFIARHGISNSRISDRTSSAPRTIYGVDIHGNLVVLVCEGRQSDQRGLTFPECWEVMREFNVTDCGNADGGNSSAMVLDGDLLNSQYRSEFRRVVHQVLFFADGEITPPPTGETMSTQFKVIVPVKSRKTPSMFEEVTKGNHAVGHEFTSSVTETHEETIEGKKHLITWRQNDADKFWYPMVYKGVAYLVEVGDEPPAPEAYAYLVDKGVTRKFKEIPEG